MRNCRKSGARKKWTLDGADMISDPDISVGSSVNGAGDVVSYVNISSVQIKFGGEYVCSARNDVGSIQQIAHLYVYGEYVTFFIP